MTTAWKPIAVAAFLGLATGALSPLSSPSIEIATPDRDWALPDARQISRFEIADMAAVGRLPWSYTDPKEVEMERQARVVWHLRGIVSSPERAAIVQTGTDPVMTRVKAGEALPDGALIQAIEDNRIEIEREGCRSTIALYERGITPESSQATCRRPPQERANANP